MSRLKGGEGVRKIMTLCDKGGVKVSVTSRFFYIDNSDFNFKNVI